MNTDNILGALLASGQKALFPPVDARWPVSQGFGERPEYYSRWNLPGHEGIDYATPIGTPVYASHSGFAKTVSSTGNYGLYVEIALEDVVTRYAHLSKSLIRQNVLHVRAGDPIGLSGDSGNVQGAHLHFMVKIKGLEIPGYKGWTNPEDYMTKEVPMPSKLTFHLHKPHYPAWLKAAVAVSRVNYIKIMDPDQSNEASPFGNQVRYVFRLYFGGEPDKRLVYNGALGAEEYFRMTAPRLSRVPWGNIIEGPNEVFVNSVEQAERMVEFYLRYNERVRETFPHFQVAFGCFSTGNPPNMEHYRILGKAFGPSTLSEKEAEKQGYLLWMNLHEYGMHKMNLDGIHLLRYRKAVDVLHAAGWRIPKIGISETGIDFSGNKTEDGWRKWATDKEYLTQLAGYDREICKDSYVKYGSPFTWTTPDWDSFRHDQAWTERYFVPYLHKLNYNPEAIAGDYLQQFVLPQSPGHALFDYCFERGWSVISPECDFQGHRWVVGYSKDDNMQHIVHAPIGEWNNITHFDRPNESS